MKILLTGANGQLAKELRRQLILQEHEIIPLDKAMLDITSFDDVNNTLTYHHPDIVINCAAYTNVDACEKERLHAFKTNALGPKYLAIITHKLHAKLIHLSTDYVFGGYSHTPYKEYDPTNPQTIYGKSKLLGESFVMQHNPHAFIIRTAWLYGHGNNFLTTMLALAKVKDKLDIVDDQIGTPTSTIEVAQLILKLMTTQLYGTYHATNLGNCSWFDFAKKIFTLKGIPIHLNRISSDQLDRVAHRPNYSVLDNFMLDIVDMNIFSHWEVALETFLSQNNK